MSEGKQDSFYILNTKKYLFGPKIRTMVIMIDLKNDPKYNILLYVMCIITQYLPFFLSVQKSNALELFLESNGTKKGKL